VSTKEEENVKLFRQGGAQTIISPATYGGYMAAVDQKYLADYLEDFLTVGGQVNIVEQTVEGGDIGKTAHDLQPDILLRVYRHDSLTMGISRWPAPGVW